MLKPASGNLTEVRNTISRWNSISLGDEFTICNVIGSGSFGEVIKVIKKPEDHEYALKIVKFDSNRKEAVNCYREVKALGKLTHSNIVRYYNSWTKSFQIPYDEYQKLKDQNESLSEEISKITSQGYSIPSAGENNLSNSDEDSSIDSLDEDELCSSASSDYIEFGETEKVDDKFKEVQFLFIQMELCEKKTLRDVIDADLYLDEETTSKYFKEICEGLDHIHQNGIVHRDLKPNNIFLTKGNQIKIGDFGLCKEINESTINDFSADNNYRCGTLIYNAPELLNQPFSKKADIYSLGVIYLEMCSKPMTDSEKIKILISLNPQSKLEEFFSESNINSNAKRLIKELLHWNFNKRPTCEEILMKLNLQKNRAMIRDQIQDNTKICIQQKNIFRKILKNIHNSLGKKEFFLETAITVFRLYGGHNISMPIFTPPCLYNNYHYNSLTGLINGSGYTVSLANSSRMAFCQYVIENKLKDIARYSVGKVFVEKHFLPLETIECSFQRISSRPSDSSAAEVLSIIKRVIDDTFKGYDYNLKFIINDGFLLKILLNNCALDEHQRTRVELLLFNLWEKLPSKEELHKGLISCKLRSPDINKILQCSDLFHFQNVKNKIQIICKDSRKIKQTLLRLEKIIESAHLYGIKNEDIYICPLLITQKYWPNFMFKVVMGDKHLVAFGDRFDNLLNQSKRTKRSKTSEKLKIHGVDLSFVVDNVVELLEFVDVKSQPHLDVLIVSKKRTTSDAICIHKKLLDLKISSEINNSETVHNGYYCRLIIKVLSNSMVTVESTDSNGTITNWNSDWRDPKFLTKVVLLVRPSTVTYYSGIRSVCL